MDCNCNCNTNNANRSIHCTVTQCKNHCNTENYCSLNAVSIGTHEPMPSEPKCVDCNSFIKK